MNDLKELRELLAFAFELQDAIRKTLEDRRVTLIDIRHFLPLLYVTKPALENMGNPLERWENLLPEERVELIAYAKNRFDLGNNQVEELILETLNEIAGDIAVAKKWIAYRRRTAA